PVPAKRGASPPARGMTLAELQAIGREVGIAPERIADAASALDRRRARVRPRKQLGLPIAVGRSVDLPRPLTDREWALLVSELRETFHARGNESSRGELRQWTNGNLHAFVEPTESGYRLRLGTLKGDATPVNLLGAGGILMGGILLAAQFVAGAPLEVVAPLVVGAMGTGAFGFNALRLPRWAQEREQQMEYIAERARALVAAAPEPAPQHGEGS